MTPLQSLRHHVTGAIERGEVIAIVEKKREFSFAEILSDRIRELGITRADASRIWDIPYRTLSDWQTGKRTPRGIARQAIIDKINSPATAN